MLSEKPAKKPKPETVLLELHPASGVDVLGDGVPPLLWQGIEREFTPAEARELLKLRNAHGSPVVRIVEGDQA